MYVKAPDVGKVGTKVSAKARTNRGAYVATQSGRLGPLCSPKSTNSLPQNPHHSAHRAHQNRGLRCKALSQESLKSDAEIFIEDIQKAAAAAEVEMQANATQLQGELTIRRGELAELNERIDGFYDQIFGNSQVTHGSPDNDQQWSCTNMSERLFGEVGRSQPQVGALAWRIA